MVRMNQFMAAAALGLLVSGAAWAGPNDSDSVARTLVEQCANIKKGDIVLVSGRPSDMALLESVAVQVRKAGAFPMVSVSTDTMARRMFDEVPAALDSQTNELDMKMAGLVNAVINVESTENPKLFAGASPERMAARAKAGIPTTEAFLKHNVKQVSLGNGLFPTEATAQMYGMDKSQLSEVFWSGVNTDYTALQATGEHFKKAFETGKTIHVTNPNGTDLTFKVDHRKCFVSDGVISKDDAAKGGAACQVWLPAGEVYTTPTPGTASGRIVFDRVFFDGNEITGVTMEFQNGKMSSMTAAKGIEPMKAMYDAAGPGKDEFSLVDIGINPSVKIPANTKMQSWVPAGMVSLGIGGNSWAGGANTCGFGFNGFVPGSTVTIDDKVIIEKGVLKH